MNTWNMFCVCLLIFLNSLFPIYIVFIITCSANSKDYNNIIVNSLTFNLCMFIITLRVPQKNSNIVYTILLPFVS